MSRVKPVEPVRAVSAPTRHLPWPVDAALEGFRFTREHPRAIALWGALSFVSGLAGAAILIGTGAQDLLLSLPKPDPTQSAWVDVYVAAIPKLAPAWAVKSVIDFLVFAVLACSAFRALLRDGGRARLALGGDELRMAALLITFALINFGIVVVASGLTGIVTLAVGGPTSAPGALLYALAQVFILIFQAVVMIRLALTSPMTVVEHRWSLAESWRRTRGRFWPMLGALVVAFLLFFVVAILLAQLFGRLGAIAHLAEGGRSVSTGLAQLADPAVLIIQVGVAVAFALGVPILAGPLAFAYRSFK